MPPRKLSDPDKQDILTLYHQTDETISSLAARYGVSNTTISRILKQSLSEQEYETLIQQKRAGVAKAAADDDAADAVAAIDPPTADEQPEPIADQPAAAEAKTPPTKRAAAPQRRRNRSGKAIEEKRPEPATEVVGPPILAAKEPPTPAPAVSETQLPLLELSAAMASQNLEANHPLTIRNGNDEAYPSLTRGLEPHPLEEAIADDLLSEDEDFADDLEDDEDDLEGDDEDDSLDDDSLDDEADSLAAIQVQSKAFIQVLPLSEAAIPKTCYLVVDRASELVTRPLRDFAELGQIPVEEVQAKTLPVFDNHRVARRYSRRMQRVVKVPDGKVLQKVGAYLQAKGITRLLIDGQVYSLDMEPD